MATIREQQKALVRDAILEALGQHVAERGLFEFSVPEIAERAGVSHRTVYNHFPSRQELLEGFSSWVARRGAEAGATDDISSVRRVASQVPHNFEAFDRLGGLSEASARIDPGTAPPSDRADRSARFRRAVEAELPDLPAADQRALAGVLRLLGSVRTWYGLTHELEVEQEAAGRVTGWAIATLGAAAAEAMACGNELAPPAYDDGHGAVTDEEAVT